VAGELARLLEADVRVDHRLAEMDFGEWEDRSWEEIERANPVRYEAWLAGWREIAPPGGESLAVFEARIREWVRERGDDIETSALVGHAGVIRALRVLGAGLTWDEVLRAPIPHLEWLPVPIGRGPG